MINSGFMLHKRFCNAQTLHKLRKTELNHFLDQVLKRWAHWCQIRMMDKSMGYPKTSPIAKFGTPPQTGNVWETHVPEDWTDCAELNDEIIPKLDKDDFEMLVMYYIATHCNKRATGRLLGISDKTVMARVATAHSNIERIWTKQAA